MLVSALPPARNIARTASAIALSVGQNEYQRQVLQLATAATSVGVVLTDPEDAFKVGAVLATRRLSHLRVAYLSSMRAPVSAFAAFLDGLRSDGEGGAPGFPALQIDLSFSAEDTRERCCIDTAQSLYYEVADLGIAVERVDVSQAAFFLPANIAKLARLRYRILFELESFDFDTTTLKERVKHNMITEFAVKGGEPWDYEVSREEYSDPDPFDIYTIHYPLALFRLFPTLQEMLLSHGRDMTITKLELLAETSPSLRILELPFTLWAISASDLVASTPGALCLFETLLLATLARFEHLERADLGLLPFSSNRPARAFRGWANKRRLRLRVLWCLDACEYSYPECNSYDGNWDGFRSEEEAAPA